MQHRQINIIPAATVVVDTTVSPNWITFILEITLSNKRRGISHSLKCISSIEVLYSVISLHSTRKEVTPKQPLQGKRLKKKYFSTESNTCIFFWELQAWMVFLFTIPFNKDLVLAMKVRLEMLQHESTSSAPAQVSQLAFNNCTQWSKVTGWLCTEPIYWFISCTALGVISRRQVANYLA